jgi:hypothetical protein
MRHPPEGVLRRLLDEPAAVTDRDRRHVAGCPRCLGTLATVREDAALVEATLGTPGTLGTLGTQGTPVGADVDLARAWQRLSSATATATAGRPGPASAPVRAGRHRALLRRPAVAALAAAAVLTGAATAAANDWLQIFATQQVAPVGITTADLVALPDLSAYGELAVSGEPDVHEVADAAAAEAESGLDVPQVADLPRGVSGRPTYQVGDRVTATFTFSAEAAAVAAAGAGEPLPPVPPGLDGSPVRLAAGPGVAQVWGSSAGAPALVVGRAVAPTASSTGVPFDVVRDYVLSLPGLPDEIADQLLTFTADGSTLPIPVPADEVTTTADEVDGVPATVLTTRDRTLAAVVWVEEGVVTVVAGAVDADEALAVARGLR